MKYILYLCSQIAEKGEEEEKTRQQRWRAQDTEEGNSLAELASTGH